MRLICILNLLLLCFLKVGAQGEFPDIFRLEKITYKPKQYKATHNIYLLPTQLILSEIQLTYSYTKSSKTAYCFSLGYRPATNGSDREVHSVVNGFGGDYFFLTLANPFYNGLYASVAPKFFIRKSASYLSTELFYRYLWFDNKSLLFYNVEGYSFDAINRNERINVFGIKILHGIDLKLMDISKKLKLVASVYYGVGFRVMQFEVSSYNYAGPHTNFNSNKIKAGTYFAEDFTRRYYIGSLHAGIKLGIGWN